MNAPSEKSLRSILAPIIGDEKAREGAREIRALIHAGKPMRALRVYDRLSENHGLEYIAPTNGNGEPTSSPSEFSGGLEYSNTGDTYATTLIYDRGRGTMRLCSWGDIAERDPRFR